MDENNVKDKVVIEKIVHEDHKENKTYTEEKFIICHICGHANPITSTMCKMCSNILNKGEK